MKSTICYLVLCIDEARTFLGLFKRLPFGPFSDAADFTPAPYDPVVVSETFYFFKSTIQHVPHHSLRETRIPGPSCVSGDFDGIIDCIKSRLMNLVWIHRDLPCVQALECDFSMLYCSLILVPHGLGQRRLVWQVCEHKRGSAGASRNRRASF